MEHLRFDGEEVVVGRSAEATLNVLDSRVSRKHAVLRRARKGWTLEVLSSVSQRRLVHLDGVVVDPGTEVDLKPGQRLSIGSSPEYRVDFEKRRLVLSAAEDTQRESTGGDRVWRVAAFPGGPPPVRLDPEIDLIERDLEDEEGPDYDAAIISDDGGERARALVKRLRDSGFFLPIAVLEPRPRTPGRFPRCGDLYLWSHPEDSTFSRRLADLCQLAEQRERSALPFRTEEILYFTGEGNVFGHDWERSGPRELRLSALQHQIVDVLGTHQREGSGHGGLTGDEIGKLLADRGWARSEQTVANELSARLPRTLREDGLHPDLYRASGTRLKRYVLSTPPRCLRTL